MRLDKFSNGDFSRGAPRLVEICWVVISALFFSSWLPGSGWRVCLLRWFGASVGSGVVIKPHVRVKFPWRLVIGDASWIGEGAWVDNLDMVRVGSHVCISQGAYLCTGSHDWTSKRFDLITRPIEIQSHAWVCAFAKVAPGAVLGEGAILSFGSSGVGALDAWSIYSGNPAVCTRRREMRAT